MNFLPVCQADMDRRGWDQPDIIFITGDAYVDHPSFGAALLGRLLESKGWKVGIVSQPRWDRTDDFLSMGRPKLCCMISAGNIDSMVAHYTAGGKPRSDDAYSPGGIAGGRPDRAAITYSSRARQAYGKDVPLIIGGLEASLRRTSHYDCWSDTVRRPILLDAKADLLVYGMGELQTLEIVSRLAAGEPISSMTDIRGTVCNIPSKQYEGFAKASPWPIIELPSHEQVSERDISSNTPTQEGKLAYARLFQLRSIHENPMRPQRLAQACGDRVIVQNPPARPLTTREFDELYEFPYTRRWHPMYDGAGGIPGLAEVQFSITSNRGCYGACSFCAITSHQGRMIQVRSKQSLVQETEALVAHPDFKGYIHDLGGPTANFQAPACDKQLEEGPCAGRQCLFPSPCPNLKDSHERYLDLLDAIQAVPGVKKVFIRSGIRYDYLMQVADDKTRRRFLEHLILHNVSGQLKIAPEHVAPEVLDAMGKPSVELYDAFRQAYARTNERLGMKQYTIPYFIAAHPGSTLDSAITLALHLKQEGFIPDQAQEFYPTPGTVATCMYYTGLDPRPGRSFAPVYVPKGREKRLQRALLQFHKPENRELVREALEKAGRRDLIPVLLGGHALRRQDDFRPSAGTQGREAEKSRKASHDSGNGAKRNTAQGKKIAYGSPRKDSRNRDR